MNILLRVETPFASIDIRGSRTPKAVLLDKPAWPVPGVATGPVGVDATLTRVFPLFFEEEDYELLAQSREPGMQMLVSHRDERTLKRLRSVPDTEPSTVVGTVRFSQSVGLTTFTFTVGTQSVDVTLEVFPSKLDYLDDYDAMVTGVRDLDRALPLRYFDETYRKMALAKGYEGGTLEWLAILRAEMQDLQQSLRYANTHPLISLEQREQMTAAHRVRNSTGQVRRTVSRGKGNGSWIESPLGIPIRTLIPVDTTRDTLDCVEHRWLRANLEEVSNSLARLSQRLRAEDEVRRARYRKSASGEKRARSDLAQQADEVDALATETMSLRHLPIVAEASRTPVPSGFTSLRLLRTPGYSEAYRLIMALRLGLDHLDGDIEVSIARLGALYEAWCFVEVLRQVEELTGAQLQGGLDGFLARAPLGTRLVKGKVAQAMFELPDGRRLAVRYNREYSGLTGSLKPDIELEFIQDGLPSLVVLLDAKYRLDVSDEQVGFYGLPAPPPEAIGALHRYRDAIVMTRTESPAYRPVVRGAALYPLSQSESAGFASSKLAEALKSYGIGAIPLLPDNTGFLKSWLNELLSLPYDELAWNGPLGPPRAESVVR